MSAAVTVLSRLDADDAPPCAPRQEGAGERPWRKTLLSALGASVLGLGLVLMPLPGPFGLPVTLLGLMLLLKHSLGARRTFVRAAQRHPRVIAPLRRLLRRRRSSLPPSH